MADRNVDDHNKPADARPLRLAALDGEDLAVVSAHLQDALVRVCDMAFVPAQRRFALVADRFDWCGVDLGRMERRRAGLHFEGVSKVLKQGVAQASPGEFLNLLSISFVASDAPAGAVFLTFSGGAVIRLDVECLEAQMRDMGPRWSVPHKPGHNVERVNDEGAER